MKYRVTCLTPTLVGDGQRLAPIDYMVWKDHVNVLDQRRIFRLLSKGPRLDGYLAQLKTAQKLDFASWGGFAQNFAGRRIPFEDPGAAAAWDRASAELLFIPTFATNAGGAYLPATAIKGALRTGAVFDRWSEATMRDLAGRMGDERLPRYFASKAEDAVLGGVAHNRMRRVAASDSGVIPYSAMKVYLIRVATLVSAGAARGKEVSAKDAGKDANPGSAEHRYTLGWKSMHGSVDARRVNDSTPMFAEMAAPGAAFEGIWREKSEADRAKLFQAANRYAEGQIARHKEYASSAGLTRLGELLAALEARLELLRSTGRGCMLSIGWGGGLVGKSAYLDTSDESYRKILRQMPLYNRAIQTGMPFPKTRRIVFEGNQPASLPGWVMLEVG